MRARNIKPALFKNELLGSADPLYTILFAGLWCMADRAGRLQDRPARIKAELFPYRDLDIETYLQWLLDAKFIDRYTTKRGSVISVREFLKHQRPHKSEPQSELPARNHRVRVPKKPDISGGASENVRLKRSDSGSLIADSGFLIPDTGSPDSGSLIPGHPPAAPGRPTQGSKTILKNGSSERPIEAGPRSCPEPRPAGEAALRALRARALA